MWTGGRRSSRWKSAIRTAVACPDESLGQRGYPDRGGGFHICISQLWHRRRAVAGWRRWPEEDLVIRRCADQSLRDQRIQGPTSLWLSRAAGRRPEPALH